MVLCFKFLFFFCLYWNGIIYFKFLIKEGIVYRIVLDFKYSWFFIFTVFIFSDLINFEWKSLRWLCLY